ncbi:MAG: trypsin-like peptidase domain-containing protein [Deltaproteobacteria bacterium]|nr:trypsin-like peptidase domain-containing protein [Deltaproteobacteria bacterium]
MTTTTTTTRNPGQNLALLSWSAPLVFIGARVFLNGNPQALELFSMAGPFVWGFAGVCAVASLISMARFGREGIIGPGVVGLVVNGLVWTATALAFAMSADISAPAVGTFASTTSPELPQVLVTHDLKLKDGRSLEGASGFFVQDPSGPVLVTARHLLGTEGGFDPPVSPSSLPSVVSSWSMHPRTRLAERTTIGSKVVVDVGDRDLLILSVVGEPVGARALIASGRRLEVGRIVFLVGCAYAEEDCVQKVRPMVIQKREGSQWWAALEHRVALQGFSGAPVVDAAGDAVGVLVSGGSIDGERPETHAIFEELAAVWRGDVKP